MMAVQKISARFGAMVKEFCTDESGATAIEYSLIVALIFLAVVSSIRVFTNNTEDMYSRIGDSLLNAP